MHGLRHVLGQCRAQVDGLTRDRVLKGQAKGMQGLARHAPQGCAAIHRVAHQGMPQVRHVHPDLVRAPGVQGALHQTAALALGQQIAAVEWKSKGGTLTPTQQRLIAKGFPVRFVGTPEQIDALRSELMR